LPAHLFRCEVRAPAPAGGTGHLQAHSGWLSAVS